MKKIFLPKILFLKNTPSKEARMLFNLCYPKNNGWDWSEYTYKKHPELKALVLGEKNKEKFYDLCYEYTKGYYKKEKKNLLQKQTLYQGYLDKRSNHFLKELVKHFETNFPTSPKIIKAFITIGTTCPRFLDSWSFWVGDQGKQERILRTCYHEILHFLWFKKWNEVFPNANCREFDQPHLIWKLSEIMDPIILNHHPKIKKMGQLYSPGYQEFQNAKIGKTKLILYYERLYKKHLSRTESFESFLKKIWNITLKHREILEKI